MCLEVVVDFSESFVDFVELLFELLLGVVWDHQEDDAGWSFRLGGLAELQSASDEAVGKVLVLALDWEMADHVHRGDVRCEDDDSRDD